MGVSEFIGLALAIIGLLFAFESPRRGFLKLIGLGRKAHDAPSVAFLDMPLEQAADFVDRFIAEGDRILEDIRTFPPLSNEDPWSYSDRWHRWRRTTESYLGRMFSTAEVLIRLKKLRPRHLQNMEAPWQQRAAQLTTDLGQEVEFFRVLRSRLPNYLRDSKRRAKGDA